MIDPSDIVGRLRAVAAMNLPRTGFIAHTMDTAAIAAAEIERLRGELQTVHVHLQHYRDMMDEKRATIADLTAVLRAIDDGWEGGKLPMFLTEMVLAALDRAKREQT